MEQRETMTAPAVRVQEDKPTTALAPTSAAGLGDLVSMSPAQHEELIANIGRAMDTRKRITRLALTLTDSQDWDDIGGKPYLRGTGAQKMLPVGLRLDAPIIDREWIEGDLFVRAHVVCRWPAVGLEIAAIGYRNTRDKFFAQVDKQGTNYAKAMIQAEHNARIAKLMIEGDIVKSAVEQATSRAVRGVLGLRNITWEELEEMGIERGAGGSVVFKEGGAAPAAGPPAKKSAAPKPKPAGKPSEDATGCALYEVGRFPVGAVLRFEGDVVSWNTLSEKVTRIQIADKVGRLEVSVFTVRDPLPDCVQAGRRLVFDRVKVGEFRGQTQYQCGACDVSEATAPDPGADHFPD